MTKTEREALPGRPVAVPEEARDAHAAAVAAEQSAADTLSTLNADANAGRDVDPDALLRAGTMLDLAMRKTASLAPAAADEALAEAHAAWTVQLERAKTDQAKAGDEVNAALDAIGEHIGRLAIAREHAMATTTVLREVQGSEPGDTTNVIRPRHELPPLETMVANRVSGVLRERGDSALAVELDLVGSAW